MKKIISAVLVTFVAMSFAIVGAADAKTKKDPKVSKKSVQNSKRNAQKTKYDAAAATNRAKERAADNKSR